MTVKTRATVEDLYREQAKAELIDGEIVRMSPTGDWPNYAAFKITVSLDHHSERTGTGLASTDNAGFLVNLPHRQSFSPDAAYSIGNSPTMKFFRGAPRFAAEVRSEGDYGSAAEQEIAKKRSDYFAAGTLVVWDVDLLGNDVVRVYRASAPENPRIYRRGETAEAEPAVPGWTMPVNDLFRTNRSQ